MCLRLLLILWRLVCLIDWPWGEQKERQDTVPTLLHSSESPLRCTSLDRNLRSTKIKLLCLKWVWGNYFTTWGPEMFQHNTSVTGVETWTGDNQFQHVLAHGVSQNQHTRNRSDSDFPSDRVYNQNWRNARQHPCLYWGMRWGGSHCHNAGRFRWWEKASSKQAECCIMYKNTLCLSTCNTGQIQIHPTVAPHRFKCKWRQFPRYEWQRLQKDGFSWTPLDIFTRTVFTLLSPHWLHKLLSASDWKAQNMQLHSKAGKEDQMCKRRPRPLKTRTVTDAL